MKDRTAKFELYQRQSVLYYLLADPSTDGIEVFCLQAGLYRNVADWPVSLALDQHCQIVIRHELIGRDQT